MRTWTRLTLSVLAACLIGTGWAAAQTQPTASLTTSSSSLAMDNQTNTIQSLSSDRINSERRHLYRVASWGGSNVVGGATLWALTSSSTQEDWNSFGLQSALWGAVNVGIAATGLLGSRDRPTSDFQEAVNSERNYSDILLANLGLNVGYMGVGTAMVVASNQGVSRSDAWRGHGTAIIIQGLGLFILDAISWVASRDRLSDLLALPNSSSSTR